MERRNLINVSKQGFPKNQKEIETLKRNFLLKDFRHNDALINEKIPTIDLSESEIQVEIAISSSKRNIIDELGFQEEEVYLEYELVAIDFYEEYKIALENSFDDYCKRFINELDKKGVYAIESLEGFKKVKLKKINHAISNLKTNSDIEEGIKDSLIEFYNKLYDFISNFRIEDYQISDKLKFKLNKSQVIWLFLSMHEKGVISGISQLDLFRFLDSNAMYFDNGKYHDMSKTRIQANKFINEHASPAESIIALNKKFDKDFFSSSI